jgi:hypothetical protein
MDCRKGCAACCIFLDISSNIPHHPNGKPFGDRCKNLDKNNACTIHGTVDYPDVCKAFKAEKEFCGDNKEEAREILSSLMK